MKKFDLSKYKENQPYFYFFDVFIKELGLSKETFLIKIGVAPSSYRKCRKGELNIGNDIVAMIARNLSLKVPSPEFIDEFEKFINKVYFDIYYKNYKTYAEDLVYVDELLKENNLLFPIIKLLKIFMIAASNEDVDKIRTTNNELYEEIIKYETFLNYGVFELFEVVYLVFTDAISRDHWIKNYDNGMSYYVLSTRSYFAERYIESLFYGEKCKSILFNDGNINRLFYLNNILMSSLISVENFEECYNVAAKQLLALKSLDSLQESQYMRCRKFKIVSLLGKREYKKIVEDYWDDESMTLTEVICILISLYQIKQNDKKYTKYEEYYKDLDVESLSSEYSQPIKMIDELLKNKNKAKKIIPELRKYGIMKNLEKILQNIVIS